MKPEPEPKTKPKGKPRGRKGGRKAAGNVEFKARLNESQLLKVGKAEFRAEVKALLAKMASGL